MAQRFFLHGGDYHSTEGSLPKGAVEVPRLPAMGETWDAKAGAYVLDTAMAADMAVPAGHIDQAHAQKAIEAVLILSGITLKHGLLAEEAEATGMEVSVIAERVHAHGEAFRAAEIERRKLKQGA